PGLVRFFSDSGWYPRAGLFGLMPMIAASVFAMVGSVLIAAPIGILVGIFCHFYAPKPLAGLARSILGLLAGIPSVVYGFWGLVVLVPKIGAWSPPGPSLLAAIATLAIMILPTVALMADASLSNVPKPYLEGAAALGLSRWSTIWSVVLPSVKSGLFTGVILQVGRALGETMAVLMVAGNVVQNPDTVFAPIRTLTSNIALEMAYAMNDHRSALFVSGLVLLLVVLFLVLISDLIRERYTHV
ncbi:MAG: phosphate ABC transporter permease subunit PstC, partial [Bdellovibrionota bacterium]